MHKYQVLPEEKIRPYLSGLVCKRAASQLPLLFSAGEIPATECMATFMFKLGRFQVTLKRQTVAIHGP